MKARKVDFYAADWLSGTRGLTPEQRGIYIDIIALIYIKGGPIENDDTYLKRNLAVSKRKARSVITSLVASGTNQENG